MSTKNKNTPKDRVATRTTPGDRTTAATGPRSAPAGGGKEPRKGAAKGNDPVQDLIADKNAPATAPVRAEKASGKK